MAVHGFRRNNHRFAASQHGGAEVCRRDRRRAGCAARATQLAREQILGMLGGQPAAVFGDADGHHLVLLFDCVQDRGGREQRDFVLAAASAEQNADPKLFHEYNT